MIEQYISRIFKTHDINIFTKEEKDQLYILGDGTVAGNNLQRDIDASIECLEHYIKYCEEQINFAKEILKNK